MGLISGIKSKAKSVVSKVKDTVSSGYNKLDSKVGGVLPGGVPVGSSSSSSGGGSSSSGSSSGGKSSSSSSSSSSSGGGGSSSSGSSSGSSSSSGGSNISVQNFKGIATRTGTLPGSEKKSVSGFFESNLQKIETQNQNPKLKQNVVAKFSRGFESSVYGTGLALSRPRQTYRETKQYFKEKGVKGFVKDQKESIKTNPGGFAGGIFAGYIAGGAVSKFTGVARGAGGVARTKPKVSISIEDVKAVQTGKNTFQVRGKAQSNIFDSSGKKIDSTLTSLDSQVITSSSKQGAINSYIKGNTASLSSEITKEGLALKTKVKTNKIEVSSIDAVGTTKPTKVKGVSQTKVVGKSQPQFRTDFNLLTGSKTTILKKKSPQRFAGTTYARRLSKVSIPQGTFTTDFLTGVGKGITKKKRMVIGRGFVSSTSSTMSDIVFGKSQTFIPKIKKPLKDYGVRTSGRKSSSSFNELLSGGQVQVIKKRTIPTAKRQSASSTGFNILEQQSKQVSKGQVKSIQRQRYFELLNYKPRLRTRVATGLSLGITSRLLGIQRTSGLQNQQSLFNFGQTTRTGQKTKTIPLITTRTLSGTRTSTPNIFSPIPITSKPTPRTNGFVPLIFFPGPRGSRPGYRIRKGKSKKREFGYTASLGSALLGRRKTVTKAQAKALSRKKYSGLEVREILNIK